jgi:hypothetical protein
MPKKGLLSLCVVLIIAIFCLQGVLHPAIQPFSNTNIQTQTTLGGNYTRLAHYGNVTGDWLGWQTSDSWDVYHNTGTLLYVRWVKVGFITTGTTIRLLNNISTDEVRTYNLTVIAKRLGSSATCDYNLRYYYTDGTYLQVFNLSTWNSPNSRVFSGVFPAGKHLYAVRYLAYMSGLWSNDYDIFALYQEDYYGYMPKLWNWTVPTTYIQKDLSVTFAAFSQFSSDISILFMYQGGGTLTMHLFADWTTPHRYYNNMSFPTEGLYSCLYTAVNEFGNCTSPPVLYFTVITETFPKNSYLSLFNALSGFPLDSKDFKIYLGQPDSRECINFRSFYGAWNQLNWLTLVNASLSDNYIKMQADHNGLRSTFENGMIYNTLYYNALQLQVKVFQPAWIVLIYNPQLWEKDFYLQFTQAQVGYWVDVTVPFLNFTSYIDVTHNNLYELGFWITNATALFADIRVAHRYDQHFMTQTFNYTRTSPKNGVLTASTMSGGSNITCLSVNGYIQAFNYDHLYVYGTHALTHTLDGNFWAIQTDSTTKTTYSYDYLEFNLTGYATNTLAFQSYCQGSVPPAGVDGNVSVYNFATGHYDLLWTISGTLTTYYAVKTNASQYVNSTHFVKIRGFSGYDYNHGVYCESGFYCDYFSVTAISPSTFYYINQTVLFPLTYNSSVYLLSKGIYHAYLSLLVLNTSRFTLSLYNYVSHTYTPIAPANYSTALINPFYYNTTQCRLKFYMNSSVPATLTYFATVRYDSYENWNTTYYTASLYRLCSLGNRQNPNNLVFYGPVETICIQDFYNNTLYYADAAYTPFLDIPIPITLATFYNHGNYSAVIRIYRGLGMYLELIVPPHSSVTTQIFCTDYRVWVANQHLQQLLVTYLSPNRTQNYLIEVGTEQNASVGADPWVELFNFLLYTPLGNFLIFLICAYLAIKVYYKLRPRSKQVPDHIAHPKVPKVKKVKHPKAKLTKNQRSNMKVNVNG